MAHPFVTIAVLFFAFSAAEGSTTTWTLFPLGGDQYNVQIGSAPVVLYIANTTTNEFSVSNGLIRWYNVSRNATLDQAPYRPADTNIVMQIAAGVYAAYMVSAPPNVIYYGNISGVTFSCDPAIFNDFFCYCGGAPVAYFHAIGTENPDTNPNVQLPVAIDIYGLNPQSSVLSNTLLGMAFSRAQMLRSDWDQSQAAVQNNQSRISKARVWGGGVMFLIAVSMEAVLIMAVTMHAWLFYIRRLSKLSNFLLWLFIFFCAQQVVSIVGGFPGWLAMFIVLVLYILILCVVYAILRRKAINAAAASGRTETPVTVISDGKVQPWAVEEGGVAPAVAVEAAGRGAGGEPAALATKWSCHPNKMGKVQNIVLISMSATVVILMTICLLVFYFWVPMDYLIWDRVNAMPVSEFAPDTVGKSTLLMYMYPRMATIMNFNIFAYYSTVICGYEFNQTLTSDADKQQDINVNFILLYNIDMSQYSRTSYSQYTSVNDWFTRTLAPGARPIASPTNAFIAVSPADCRLMVFENINSDLHVWLKGEEFLPYTLLNVDQVTGSVFNGGTMVVARLAPADYHRFHSPINAYVNTFTLVSGTIFSVNADAATSGNRVYYNKRQVSILQSNEFGQVGYVAIGATCVGSVVIEVGNQNITKGQEMGVMQFGGSTVVLLFQPGALVLDNDLLINSRRGFETRVLMGARIGVAASQAQ